MQVSSSANRNVFGYNYSLQQHDTGGSTGDDTLGDLSFHGHFPYVNLFEGNRVDRIWADNYFGSNGPYNTFCRNLAYYNILYLQWTDSTNVIGNEAKLIRYSQLYPDKTLDKYGNKLHHAHWDPTYELIDYCTDVSYYYSSRPGFIVSSSFTWPPLGPPTSQGGALTTQNIPARKKYFEEIAHESYSNDWSNEFLASDIAVYRPYGDSNPNLINRIVGFSSNGLPSTSFSYQTEIAQGGYDFKGITSGDFNGDEIDDITIYRSFGDSNPNLINLVWVFKSDGTSLSFIPQFEHAYGNNSFSGISSGDYNGDGYDDIAVYYGKTIAVFKSDGYGLLDMTNFSYGSTNFSGITSGDYNADGYDDIAVYYSKTIVVFKSNGTSFLYMTSFSYGSTNFSGITSGNYNGDGYDDIAVYYSKTIVVFKSSGSSFPYMTSFSYGSTNFSVITSGNYNNDKYNDIAIYYGKTIVPFKSTGSSFTSMNSFSWGGYNFYGITSARQFFYSRTAPPSLRKEIVSDDMLIATQKINYNLYQNYPNPFNPLTIIKFSIPSDTHVCIKIYNEIGQQVCELVNRKFDAGFHSVNFNGSELASGIYFYKIITKDFIKTNKMLLIR